MNEVISTDIAWVEKLLKDVIGTSDYSNIERMGGLTNHTYKVTMGGGRVYVVRLPGVGTEELINRANEKVSTQLACSLGLDAKMLYFSDCGEKVTCYIDGAKTLCCESFKDDAVLRKAAKALQVLHTCGVDTSVPFDVFEMATGYEKIIKEYSVPFFSDDAEVKKKIIKIREYVQANRIMAVPCHNDPLCENWVLDKDGKLFLIDWEYAGMNDSMWDLADVSIEASLTEEQEEKLLLFYFERKPDEIERLRFYANKLYLDFLWSLWGKTRLPFDGKSMEDYGTERYLRLKKNLVKYAYLFKDAAVF